MTGPSTGAVLPYAVAGSPLATILDARRFTLAQQTLNAPSLVAYLDVPDGHILRLQGAAALRMYLPAILEVPMAVGGSGDIVLQVGGDGRRMVRSTRSAPAFPTGSHPDVRAQTSIDGGATWTDAQVLAVDWGAEAVTIARSGGNVNRARVWYLPGDGEVELRAARPMGSDSGSSYIWGASLRSIHETEQGNVDAAVKIGADKNLSQRFRLGVQVRSASRIDLRAIARPELILKALDVPVRVVDASRLAALNELELRGGNL